MGALQYADSSFDSSVPLSTFHEPSPVLQFLSCFRPVASHRQDYPLDAEVVCEQLIRFRIQASITTSLLRWLLESGLMRFQTWLPLQLIWRVPLQNTVMTD